VIERGYFALIKHVNSVLRVRVWHSMAEEGVIKWVWGSLGLCICAIPVFAGEMLGMKAGDLGTRTEGKSGARLSAQAYVKDSSRTDDCCYLQVMLLAVSCTATKSAHRYDCAVRLMSGTGRACWIHCPGFRSSGHDGGCQDRKIRKEGGQQLKRGW
jgi:hypothetical protein